MKKKETANNQITIYETDDGKARIEVRFENENVWLTQRLMAELFDCSVDNISLHLKNIFKENELDVKAVTEEYSITAADGKSYKTKHYSLEAIIAVGYRVNSVRGTQFRIWATDKLKNYILKGFAIDSQRFKYGTRFFVRRVAAFCGFIQRPLCSPRGVAKWIGIRWRLPPEWGGGMNRNRMATCVGIRTNQFD